MLVYGQAGRRANRAGVDRWDAARLSAWHRAHPREQVRVGTGQPATPTAPRNEERVFGRLRRQDRRKIGCPVARAKNQSARSRRCAQRRALGHRAGDVDYPVFVAAPKTVGITSTGETGEAVSNELPDLREAYRAFEAWAGARAKPEDAQGFLLPSTA